METFLIGLMLIIVGLFSMTMGYMFFRILLPILGFVTGFSIGFSGVQALFGTSVWSYVISIFTALFVGLIVAALAYVYYTLAVVLLGASLGAGLLTFFGQAIGLREEGFVIFVLGLSGAIIGALTVLRFGLQHMLIVYLTSFYGVGLLLLASFMLVGDQTSGTLYENGILLSITEVVTSSWLWVLAWIGGGIFATYLQASFIARTVFDKTFVIDETKK